MRWLTVLLVAGCLGTPLADPVAPPEPQPDAELLAHLQTIATFPELRLETDHGTIRILLYADWTPQTAAHIVGLAERGFYDGTIVHRVVDDFVIQGGDPSGTGEGGSGSLGLPDPVPLEIHPGLDFASGSVGLARWTDDTGDSQWFITEKPALHLSRPSGTTGDVFGAYALFGQVFAGLDAVRSIAAVATLPNDRPVADVVVQEARILPPPDTDLIGLVPDVHAVHAWGEEGLLEVPRYMVAGHPAVLLFSVRGECLLGTAPAIEGPVSIDADWHAVAHDACTQQAVVSFPEAGTYTLAGRDLDVMAWHPAYAPFAGSP